MPIIYQNGNQEYEGLVLDIVNGSTTNGSPTTYVKVWSYGRVEKLLISYGHALADGTGSCTTPGGLRVVVDAPEEIAALAGMQGQPVPIASMPQATPVPTPTVAETPAPAPVQNVSFLSCMVEVTAGPHIGKTGLCFWQGRGRETGLLKVGIALTNRRNPATRKYADVIWPEVTHVAKLPNHRGAYALFCEPGEEVTDRTVI